MGLIGLLFLVSMSTTAPIMTSMIPIIRTKNASPIARKFEASSTTTIIEKMRRKIPVPILRSLLGMVLGSVDKVDGHMLCDVAETVS